MIDRDRLFWWNHLFAPTGEEEQAGQKILDDFTGRGYDSQMDRLGNVLVKAGGAGEKLLICVPYDQKGMLITGKYQNSGYFLNAIGRWDTSHLPGETGLATGEKEAVLFVHQGADSYKAPYNLEMKYSEGVKGTPEIGDKVIFPAGESEKILEGDPWFSVSTLDSRAACYVADLVLEELKNADLRYEVYVAFLALDTCCFRGSVSLAGRLNMDSAVVIGCRPDDTWKDKKIAVNHIGTKYLSDPVMVRRFGRAAQETGTALRHCFCRPQLASAAIDSADSLVECGCRTLSVSLPVWEENWRAGYVSGQCVEGLAQTLVKMVTM